VDLASQIEKLGLQVETIIPVHSKIGSLADLKAAMLRGFQKNKSW